MLSLALKILFLAGVVSVTGKYVQDEEIPDLKWPKKYTFEARKVSLSSGLVEDVQFWRTSKKSRVDYNGGADKSIAMKGKFKSAFPFGVKYEVHPQSTSVYLNKLFCSSFNGTILDKVELEEQLPTASDFAHVGKDILESGQVEKFTYVHEGELESNEITVTYIWAYLDRDNSSWIPVRVEKLAYNAWLESLKEHIILYIFNFNSEFVDSVFDIKQYNCTDAYGGEKTNQVINVDPENAKHVDFAFNTFMGQYGRRYENKREHELRRNIFQKNLRLIQAHNRQNSTYKLTLNKFADRTPEEMRRRMGLRRRKTGENGTHPFPYSKRRIAKLAQKLPSSVDLRLEGLITPVKDQGDCGSCWTFGTTSAVEGAIARANGGRLLTLANQALIDCSWGTGNGGCNGGSDTDAYRWLIENGLPTEAAYGPYRNKDGFCHIANMKTLYHIKGFTDVTPFSVDALKVALVNHGPLSVSIDATDKLGLYSGGIFYDANCDPSSLNHEVTLVGYADLDGIPYWIVKNSWGHDWGIDGYFHIAMEGSSCGILTEPTYAIA